jgi:hypothetical protein
MKTFEELGYKSGVVRFPGIDILADIGKDCYFRNDGMVKNIQLHEKKVDKEFGKRIIVNENYKGVLGVCMQNLWADPEEGFIRASTMCYVERDPVFQAFTKGHEATHAVTHLDAEEFFLKDLRTHGFKFDPFSKYKDLEDQANFGGYFALFKKGLIGYENPRHKHIIRDLIRNGRR